MSGGKENLNQSCNSIYSKTASSPPAHSGAQKRSLLVRRRQTRNWPWWSSLRPPLCSPPFNLPHGTWGGGCAPMGGRLTHANPFMRGEQIVLSVTQPITAHPEWRGVASVAPLHLTPHKTFMNSIFIFIQSFDPD